MKGKALSLILLCSISVNGQSNWKEQPRWFGIGLGIGLAEGARLRPVSLAAGMGVGKMAYDLSKGFRPDPFTASYGIFLTSLMKQEWRRKKMKKRNELERLEGSKGF